MAPIIHDDGSDSAIHKVRSSGHQIPVLSLRGLIAFSLLLGGAGIVAFRRSSLKA